MARETASIQLKAQPSNGQLLVSWNQNAAVIKTAQSAVLSISDGAKAEDVPLDLTQLHAGSIMYSPLSGEVGFRLEVRGSGDGKSLSEFVRVPFATPQSTDSASAAAAGKPAQPPQQAQQPPKVAEAARSDEASRPAEDTQAQPQRASAPPKPFSLAARIRQPEPTDLPEAPGVIAGGASSVIRPSLPGHLPAPPPAPAAQAPAAAPASTQAQNTTRVGGKVQEPKLLRRVDAIYPPMARQARVGGVVRLQASIGKDGRIKKLEVLSGPPLLKQAAIDAVQKWVYSPSLLNGSPVESNTDIDVNFNLNSR
jgi:protein TonB